MLLPTLTSTTHSSSAHAPEDIALRSGIEVPPLLLPDPAQVFAARGLRLRQLAAGHAMRDYLMLLALVCEAQHARAVGGPALPLPTQVRREAAAEAGEPLLNALGWPRDALWCTELRALLGQVIDRLAHDNPARTAVQAAIALPDETLEQQADRLLAGITTGVDLATAPLIAAGLQLHFTRMVAASGAAHADAFAPPEAGTRCPCCGSLPVASLTRLGGVQEGQRYLHCTLCNAQWHLNRIQCTHCLATEGIGYRALQPVAEESAPAQPAAIEAETCESCRHYLKIMHMARDLHVEPVADDLATLTLDLLVSEAGFERHGTNMLLLFGDSDSVSEEGTGQAGAPRS